MRLVGRGTEFGLVTGLVVCALLATTAAAYNRDARLADAAERQDWDALTALLDSGTDPNEAHADGATALQWAAHWNNLQIVGALLDAGAHVDAANDHGVTPLFLASENGSVEVATRLLAAGADPNATLPAQGETILMAAALTGSLDIVEMLLDRGAEVNARTTKSGQTALMWAISEQHVETARVLVEHGADVRDRSNGHYTPMLFAAQQGSIDIAIILMEAGAGVNRDGDGPAPLVVAIGRGHVPLARFFVKNGAMPNILMANGNTPLGAALAVGGRQLGYDANAVVREPPDKLDLIRDLLAAGADPNGRRGVPQAGSRVYSPDGQASGFDRGPTDPDNFGVARGWTGATPFWVAAHKADVRLMQLLLDAGADSTLTTDDGTTPLMVASGLSHAGDRYERFWSFGAALEAVAFLVERGADPTASNDAGFTALHGAAFVGADDVADYLVTRGAELNAQDFVDRTAYRIAQGHKGGGMSFVSRPATATLLADFGADTSLGPHFNDTEREEGLKIR